MCWEGEVKLPCNGSAAAAARRFASERLVDALGSSQDAQDALASVALVTSELTTNAVRADCSYAVLSLSLHRTHVRISLDDDGGGTPEVQHPPPDQGHGRGLQIVARVSRSWGVVPTDTGKRVWADLSLPGHLTTGLTCEETA